MAEENVFKLNMNKIRTMKKDLLSPLDDKENNSPDENEEEIEIPVPQNITEKLPLEEVSIPEPEEEEIEIPVPQKEEEPVVEMPEPTPEPVKEEEPVVE
ncbi:MAG: hypothetical protein PHT67_00670, partial [Candidatus Pacebacteria bacterium]|nr:hypothetical protein [Candidatus Paceibacterota bacterium]